MIEFLLEMFFCGKGFSLQVRNARGKIVEGAQEKRDQLIQTFKVFLLCQQIHFICLK